MSVCGLHGVIGHLELRGTAAGRREGWRDGGGFRGDFALDRQPGPGPCGQPQVTPLTSEALSSLAVLTSQEVLSTQAKRECF